MHSYINHISERLLNIACLLATGELPIWQTKYHWTHGTRFMSVLTSITVSSLVDVPHSAQIYGCFFGRVLSVPSSKFAWGNGTVFPFVNTLSLEHKERPECVIATFACICHIFNTLCVSSFFVPVMLFQIRIN